MRVQQLQAKEFKKKLNQYDQVVMDTPDISTFYSGSDWILSAHEELHEPSSLYIWKNGMSWLTLAKRNFSPFKQSLQPLEMVWSFDCPLVGSNPANSVSLLMNILGDPSLDWDILILAGVPQNSSLWFEISRQVSHFYPIEVYEGTHCMQSDLSQGEESFLSRRTSKFRTNLRRNLRRAEEEKVNFELIDSFENENLLVQRIMDVERRSWKYKNGTSIFQLERYFRFYKSLLHRLFVNKRLRLLFARHRQCDIAYIFGGVLGSTYRGLQLSYDEKFARFGLGHLVQWSMIQHLCKEEIKTYDLGMVMDYKSHWADKTLSLLNVAIFSPLLLCCFLVIIQAG